MNDVREVKIEQIKVWNGQRVVTFKDIDEAHERPKGTARRNFSYNKKHFVEGVDYFKIKPTDLENTELHEKRTIGISNVPPRGISLITESGYLMIVKSFDDDLSWEVQRQLVNGYFKAKEEQTYRPVVVDQFPEEPTKTVYQTTTTLLPKNPNWYQRNNRRMKRICEKSEVPRRTLYHHILMRLGEEYDLDAANRIYAEETGAPPEYPIDIVSYFPQLAAMADDYLDGIEKLMR